MTKTWAEIMNSLSYCNYYKMMGEKACLGCKNMWCKHHSVNKNNRPE